MSSHNTEFITGLVDNELKGLRLWLAKRHINSCPACAEQYQRQQEVRRLLQANPPAPVMSDSPEFFWSKVKSEIQRRGNETVAVTVPQSSLGAWSRQYQYALASAAALLIAVGSGLWFLQRSAPTPFVSASAELPSSFSQVDQLKTPVPHSTATAFDSEDAGVTVIWTTGLPWTKNMNEMKTQFAHLDT